MVTIQVDEQTAVALQTAAMGAGVSLADYLKSLVDASPRESQASSWDALETEFVDLSVEGSLPTDFSRADIYADHDWWVTSMEILVLKQAIACLSESDFRSAAATEPAGLVW